MPESAIDQDLAASDLGPLAWVMDELRKSLEAASVALRRFLRDAQAGPDEPDAGPLRMARQQLHQAVGALEMVGLAAPAQVLRAMECAVQAFADKPSLCTEAAASRVERAGFAVAEFLGAVLLGKAPSAVALFPQYRDVQALWGADRVHPADLWPFDWSWQEPRRQAAATASGRPPLVLGYAPPVRARMDQAVLRIVKSGDVAAAGELAEICAGLAAGESVREPRSFWLLVAGFFEAIAAGLLPTDVYVKRAASRVLLQYAQLAKGDHLVSERLAQDLAFFCAQAVPAASSPEPAVPTPSRLEAVREAWRLDGHVPVDYEHAPFGRFDPALLAQVRKRLAAAREGWSGLSGGDTSKARHTADQFSQLCESLVRLHEPLVPLSRALAGVAGATLSLGLAPQPELAMEAATAILFLEAITQDFDPADPLLAARAAQLAQRLEQACQGQPPQPLEPWMEELYRRVSDRQMLGSVVGELRVTLGELEKNLDAFFRQPQDRTPLHAVPGQLSQMRGVLSVLGLDQAAQAVLRMRDTVQALLAAPQEATSLEGAQPAAVPTGLESLGNTLGALGFLIDMLAYQPALARKLFVLDEASGELRPVMGRAMSRAVPPPPAVPPGPERPLADLPGPDLAPPAVVRESMAPAVAGLEMIEVLELTDLPDLPELPLAGLPPLQDHVAQAQAVGNPPDDPAGDEFQDTWADDGELAAHEPGQDGPQAMASGHTQAQDADPDDEIELKAIFLDEAREVLGGGRESLETLAADPADAAALAVLRRAFHTLKGSSRMVGLQAFGEAAWSLEQVLNVWLADHQPASPELLTVAGRALEGLARWLEDIATGQDAPWSESPFHAPAEAFRLRQVVMPFVFPGETQPATGLAAETGHASGIEAVADAAAEAATDAEAGPASTGEESWKVIDTLRIPLPLFNVFLQEADEWSRQLQGSVSEWASDPQQAVPESLVALAHSLAGSSATVGFQALSFVARSLEASLQRAQALAWGTPQHARAWTDAAEEILRLLHQFAAGFLREARPQVLEALMALDALDAPPRPQPEAQPQALQADGLDHDLFPYFEEEALALLPRLGQVLRGWHGRPGHPGDRDEALRVLHTLKGSARLAGARGLGEQAHAMESAIESLGPDVSADAVEPLLHRFDALQAIFNELRDTQAPAPAPADIAASEAARPEASPAQSQAEAPLADAAPRTALAAPVTTELAPQRAAAGHAVRVRSQLLDRMMNQAGEVMITRSRLESELKQLRGSLHDLTANLDRLRGQLRDVELQAELQMQSRLAQAKDAAGFDPLEFDRFTRVQELTRMMAESVNDVATVQRQLQRTVAATEDDLIAQARQTRELQRDLLRTRMVEFDAIADRLHGVVRQAAKETGKHVRLAIEGGRIEMDRGVLDRMTPAFEHLLRNAVAHGIEAPGTRMAAGKEPTGHIRIRLAHEGNDVSVSFQDDGAGLDLGRIREKAFAHGLLRAGEVLDEEGAAQLIFLPGFSTAGEVTELAGRGIGMDVVRSEVNALGGRIETATRAGQGLRFLLVLPLTTAVTQVVMVRCGALTFGLPAHLVEIIHRAGAREVQNAYNAGHFLHEGQEVPFHWGGALLRSSRRSAEPQQRSIPVVVLRSAAQRLALHVDEVLGHQEVVVKNLGPQLARLPGLAGMTVLASGAVVLIYNPVALAAVYGEQARLFGADQAQPHVLEAGGTAGTAWAALAHAGGPLSQAPQLPLVLVVDDSITVRRVTQRLLQREGYRVATAIDGLQALEKLEQERPAVVLSDIEMPRMDGFDLLRNIRADERWRELPVIMITSRIAAKHREHAAELGASHYLGKPYREDELLSLVRRYAAADFLTTE